MLRKSLEEMPRKHTAPSRYRRITVLFIGSLDLGELFYIEAVTIFCSRRMEIITLLSENTYYFPMKLPEEYITIKNSLYAHRHQRYER